MRFEKLKDTNLLKPGQLLVVSKYCKFYGDVGLLHLPESAEIGLLQFYRHRQEPVPRISRAKHGRMFRRPKTTNERRAHFSNNATEEILQSYGAALKLRQKRKWHMLPNAYHDLSLRYQRSWKEPCSTCSSCGEQPRRGLGINAVNGRLSMPPETVWLVRAEGKDPSP
jgi:hypothetical protein